MKSVDLESAQHEHGSEEMKRRKTRLHDTHVCHKIIEELKSVLHFWSGVFSNTKKEEEHLRQ